MLRYSLKCRKNTESKVLKVVKTKTGRSMCLSNWQFAIVKNWNSWKSKKLEDY